MKFPCPLNWIGTWDGTWDFEKLGASLYYCVFVDCDKLEVALGYCTFSRVWFWMFCIFEPFSLDWSSDWKLGPNLYQH